jgi:Fe2+ transport system protein FeoA
MTNVIIGEIVMSFGHGTKDEKKSFLRSCPEKKVYMDLTCFDPEEFYGEFPNLKGSFAALFADEGKRIEVHYREKSPVVEKKLAEMGFTAKEVTFTSCGFIFPRTIVQIINEAYFALEEGVATKEDIDRAMKFGVNYPKGPFEWVKDREEVTLTLLNELYEKYGDKRYVASDLMIYCLSQSGLTHSYTPFPR